MSSIIRLCTLLLFVLAAGCGTGEVAAQAEPSPVASVPVGPVTRIVFIGQEEACACTTKRIAEVTVALTAALRERQVEIERLQADRPQDQEAVELHRTMRAFVVAPALFFFDAQDRLVDMTQGEVSAEELTAILGAPPAP